jgi:hypothetical protein
MNGELESILEVVTSGYIAREQTTKKTPPPIPLLLHEVITGQTPKKTPPIVESCQLPSNSCKQTLALLTRSVHVTIYFLQV